MTVGLCVCSPARPLFPASLPVRVPMVESLSSALSFGPLRFLPGRSTTVAVIDSVGNSHPERISTCRAHERGIYPAGTSLPSNASGFIARARRSGVPADSSPRSDRRAVGDRWRSAGFIPQERPFRPARPDSSHALVVPTFRRTEVRGPIAGRSTIVGGARDSSRRNVPSIQRARFHRPRLELGRSGGLKSATGPISPSWVLTIGGGLDNS
jgi:hypothetical protein